MRLIDADKIMAKLREMEFYAEDRLDKRPLMAIRMVMSLVQEQEAIEIPMKTTEKGKHEAVL